MLVCVYSVFLQVCILLFVLQSAGTKLGFSCLIMIYSCCETMQVFVYVCAEQRAYQGFKLEAIKYNLV